MLWTCCAAFPLLVDSLWILSYSLLYNKSTTEQTRMWANAQRDGRPAEYRWRPLFNAAVWLTPTTRVPCSNAAKTRNPLKLAGVPQTNETISAASGLKFTILWGHVEEILLLNKFLPIVDTCPTCEDIARQSCAMVPRWRIFGEFFASRICSEPRAAHFRPAF